MCCRSLFVCSGVRVTQSYPFCVVFCDPLFVVGLVLLNLMLSVLCFVIPCLYYGSCYSILCFLYSILWFLVCIRVRVTQSDVFCVVFCDPLFVVGFALLNLKYYV